MPIRGANAPVAGALGRDTELGQIEAWLALGAAPGPAGPRLALVVEGEPGIGKTTLWTEATGRARAAGWHVLSCRPAASDAGLPHVGLADLLRSVPDDAFARLPAPQRRALGVALLREEASGADLDPRAVGTGLTALLGLIGSDGPLMLAVDDAQWLDPASARALGFALRRLNDLQLRLVTAVRTEGPAGQRTGAFAAVEASLDRQAITRIVVGPLSVAAIHQMFVRTLGSSFARPVLVRIHRAAGGNPFYALEIGREVQRLGVPPPSQPLPIPGDHRDLVLLRLRRLPRATRDVLTVVAAMARPSTADLDLDALAPAEVAGIVRVRPGGRTEFTHPLFGSALYSSLPEASRRRLHRDLAERAASPEERARHLALAADGPDEATAAALDEAAAAAAAHGAADVAVELAELARNLTPHGDTPTLVRRETELAERRYFAGDPTGSRQELERFLASLPAGEDRALVLLELGSLLWVQGESEPGLAMMSQALGEAGTPGLRASIHTRIASGSDDADIAVEHGEAALALTDENADPQLYSYALLVVAMFKLHSGRGADHAAVEKGMRLQRQAAGWVMSPVPAFWARNFDDFGTARQRLEDFIEALREQGDHAQAAPALTHLARIEAMTGHMDSARALTSEALDLAAQTDQETYLDVALCARAHVCAYAGELDEARGCASDVLDRLGDRPDAVLEGMAREALGLAALQTGDLAEADRQFTRAEEINDLVHNREPANQRFQADHAEAVIGIGDLDRAERLVARLEARAGALPRPWILAVSCRCRGLINAARGDLDQALADYQRALTTHERLDMPVELGRTLLAQGRLHRRRNERQRAQDCLSRAATVFGAAGAPQWAAVAREELGRAQGRRGSADRLTPTELQVAELAVAGLRNTEIAARLFLSGKTVEANLSRIYRKLGVRSRTELAAKMPRQGTPAL
ncbi:MAG TPA: AAA family ATPase [Streptosporangiaceae bacterium]|nr:AAA family ATPase [Streptosporangiaceae bacterium]